MPNCADNQRAEPPTCTAGASQRIQAGQQQVPERRIAVVEDIRAGVNVVESLGRQAQAHVLVPEDLEHLQ